MTSLMKKIFSGKERRKFPVFSVKDNKVRSVNGKLSHCFKYVGPDIEQLKDQSFTNTYNKLQDNLISMPDNSWIKVYRNISNQQTLITVPNDNLSLTIGDTFPLTRPVQEFTSNKLYSDINFYESYLTVGYEFWRIIHIEKFPNDIKFCELDYLGVDYTVSIKKISKSQAKRKLTAQRRRQANTDAVEGSLQNHSAEESYHESNELLRDITFNTDAIFKVNAVLIIKSNNLDDLAVRTEFLMRNLLNSGYKAFICTNSIAHYFSHSIIGIQPTFKGAAVEDSKFVSYLFPIQRDFIHERGLELSARSGYPISINPYDNKASNYNWLITGMSGQGKSYLACALAMYFKNENVSKLGIIDLGGSLRKVSMYIDAVILDDKINPMQFNCPYFLKRFILSFLDRSEFKRSDEGKIFAISKSYLENDSIEKRSFKGLVTELSKEFYDFEYYFSEYWDFFTDQIIDIPSTFYLETKGRPEGLIPGYMIFIKEIIERQDGKVALIWDEVWNILDKTPEIIKEKSKTSRKNHVFNGFITQEIVELKKNYPIAASALIGNTYAKVCFYQPDVDHHIFDDFEKETITNLRTSKGEYSEFAFITPENVKVARLPFDSFMYELSHSEPSDLSVQWDFLHRHMEYLSFQDSFSKWHRFKYE